MFRIAIDRAGAVTNVDGAIAISDVDGAIACAVPASDSGLERQLPSNRYDSATLAGRPIAATIFVERQHRCLR